MAVRVVTDVVVVVVLIIAASPKYCSRQGKFNIEIQFFRPSTTHQLAQLVIILLLPIILYHTSASYAPASRPPQWLRGALPAADYQLLSKQAIHHQWHQYTSESTTVRTVVLLPPLKIVNREVSFLVLVLAEDQNNCFLGDT